jgi:L-fuculose-phosphate aldolase
MNVKSVSDFHASIAAMSRSTLPTERAEVAAASRRLAAAGLVHGTAGNVSRRSGDLVAITPTGAVLAEVDAEDVAVVGLDGVQRAGPLAPTSELDLHLGAYRRYEPGAVVHCHAPVATALSCVLDELPVVHYEMLMLGGAVRVAPYATFGSPELAERTLAALEGRAAVLMANHGALVQAGELDTAVRLTELLEWSATVYWRAAQVGEPRVLGEDALQAVAEAAVRKGYGTTQRVEGET